MNERVSGGSQVISVNQLTLRGSIDEGIKLSKEKGIPQFVSHVEEVHPIDPIVFFENGETQFSGERCFWESPDQLTVVGMGAAFTIEGSGMERIQTVNAKWEAFKEQVICHPVEKGTGPILIGGLSFDPQPPGDSVWKTFPQAGFVVPLFVLTIYKNRTFLTINRWVTKESDGQALIEEIQAHVQALLKNKRREHRRGHAIRSIQDLQKDQWFTNIDKITNAIREGELEKVVLSREVLVKADAPFKISSILWHLSKQQTNSYIFAMEQEEACFLGATPERLIERKDDRFRTGAVAGTIGRGQTPKEDQEKGEVLLYSHKNREEHQYVVNMILHAMRDLCNKLESPDRPELLKVKDVQHLFTPISGIAKEGVTLLDVVERLHPTPALGGMPRDKALTWIRKLETHPRGWYAAPIGWMDQNGQGEFAVAIRSGLVQGDEAHLYAGCGVVEASNAIEEFEETHLKLRPMLRALEGRESDDV